MKFMSIAMSLILLTTTACAETMAGSHHSGSGSEAQEHEASQGGMPMTGMMRQHCAMLAHTEGALAFLKAELAITSAQLGVWDSFASTFKANAEHNEAPMGEHSGHQKGMGSHAPMPFPMKAEQHLQMMKHHLESMRKLTDAAKTLYDALSADQRHVADELMPHLVMSHCGM